MSNINEYHFSRLDLEGLREFFIQQGVCRAVRRKEYIVRQGERFHPIGFVERGMFRHLRTDSSGKEHVVGYSPENEFAGDYAALLCGQPSSISLQAVCDSTIYLVSHNDLENFWQQSPAHQQLGRNVAEQLFAMAYRRLTDSYCLTPEERYVDLMRRYPTLKEQVPLREIASFIGVTPETVSRIRRALLQK